MRRSTVLSLPLQLVFPAFTQGRLTMAEKLWVPLWLCYPSRKRYLWCKEAATWAIFFYAVCTTDITYEKIADSPNLLKSSKVCSDLSI
jgi:hypothetical protein